MGTSIHLRFRAMWALVAAMCLFFASGTVWGQSGNPPDDGDTELVFEFPVSALIQAQTGRVVRADLHRLGPGGIRYAPKNVLSSGIQLVFMGWDEVKVLNLPEISMKYSSDVSVQGFLESIADRTDLSIRNRHLYQDGNLPTGSMNSSDKLPPLEIPQSDEASSPPKMQSEESASDSPEEDVEILSGFNLNTESIVVICVSCGEEVTGNSESGQTCPHCGILWDNNPFIPEDRPVVAVNMGGYGDPGNAGGGGFQNPAQGNANVPGGGGGLAPVVAPESSNLQGGPTEITFANLPVWIKVAVFVVTSGVLYYSFFYLR
ncbi:hypothetical protein KOR42_14870 [Thalassoglobus neptunius]|uniref:Uncharacterized protein n=1 Tax=Thalassoglobus neptunius TaxID=1938619 RepID=A0A5C5X528_9PLAN|nr:hypothetical protein [Thalassoglobus neptunius]TWT58116.1 hypothetical protein KOR42_14870 [Thalassoglobus neptunius]